MSMTNYKEDEGGKLKTNLSSLNYFLYLGILVRKLIY